MADSAMTLALDAAAGTMPVAADGIRRYDALLRDRQNEEGVDSLAYARLTRQAGRLGQVVFLAHQDAYADCRGGLYYFTPDIRIHRDPLAVIDSGRVLAVLAQVVGDYAQDLWESLRADTSVSFQVPSAQFIKLLEGRFDGITVTLTTTDSLLFQAFRLGDSRVFAPILRGASIAPFPSGDYRIPADIEFVLRLILRDFMSADVGGGPFTVVVTGFADNAQIRAPGLPYDGGADLSLARLETRPFVSGRPTSSVIRTNLELSIARGYSGAEAAARAMGEASESSDRRFASVLYAGGGALGSGDTDRRVELTIRRDGR